MKEKTSNTRNMALEKIYRDLKDSFSHLQKEMEELKAEKEKYMLIAEFSNNWEFWIDGKGHFSYISPACKNLTGYSRESFLSDPNFLMELIHPDDREDAAEFLKKSLDFTLLGNVHNFRLFTRTRQLIWCELRMKAVYNQLGEYLGHRGSIHDISRLMQALDKIGHLSSSVEIESQARQEYREKFEHRNREMTTSLMKMAQKNELLQHVKKQLENMEPGREDLRQKFRSLISAINNDVLSQGQWEEFRLYFEQNHPGFFQRLSDRFPQLTGKDIKLCAYLRLQLNTKEIASLLNISPKSTEVSRVRLRRKLGLNRSQNLSSWISRI